MKKLEVNGCSIAVDDRGYGPAVLWIHGFPLSRQLFQHQLEIEGFRHLAPDLPGFGDSPFCDRIDGIDSYAELLLALVDQSGIQRFAVAGVSMGGYIAFRLMEKAGERVTALLLLDTREKNDTEDGRKGRYAMIEEVKKRGPIVVVEKMLDKMVTNETARAQTPAFLTTREMFTHATVDGIVAALKAMAERPDSTDLLSRISIPTLVLAGSDDSITPPADAERMAGAIKGSQVAIVSGGAHLAILERHDEANRIIERFLQQHVGKVAAQDQH